MPNLKDLAIRRQVMLERVKAGQVRGFAPTFTEIEGIVRSAVLMNDTDISAGTRKDLNTLLAQLNRDVRDTYNLSMGTYRTELGRVGAVYAQFEVADLTSAIANVNLVAPDPSKVFSVAQARPMGHSGELMDTFLNRYAGRETRRLSDAIRQGFTQGQTNQEMIANIIGTRARRFKDGVISSSVRNAEAVIQTATQHVASSARQQIWEANPDVIEKYEWVSTLDRKTTPQCQVLDKQQFVVGQGGPMPPIHMRCRSTTVSVPKPGFEFLSQGRTRSGERGPVDANLQYYDWLKTQPKSFQLDALGKQRFKVFDEGGISPSKFRSLGYDRNFQPVTLEQMKVREPAAFKKAGVLQNPDD